MDEILTVNEFSEHYKIGLSTAFKLVHRKGFPAVRIGRRILIPTKYLDKWLCENLGIIR
jgi:excisionase family DNA binding protein